MKVVELIKQLEMLPQDATVVVKAYDHSYRAISLPWDAQADYHLGQYSEFDDECGYPAQGAVVNVVVFE